MRKLINELLKELKKSKNISKIKSRLARKYKLKQIPKNLELLNLLDNREKKKYGKYFITKPVRTLSGVAPVAIMSKPVKCLHGKCIFCPGGPGSFYGDVPQSYTGKEPATMRGIRNNFDPYFQVMNRLEHYIVLGQIPEKVELIIMGGTFLSFDGDYKEEFVKYAFKAMNDFSKLFYDKDEFNFKRFKEFFELPGRVSDPERTKKIISKLKNLKGICSLEREQIKNEKSKIRCVALCIETRPDYCKEEHVKEMLRFGCTRVELGIQSVYDDVLSKVERGHSVEDIINATRLLKENGFKVVYHVMIGLPGSYYERDLWMFNVIFNDERFKPDGLKIYPCVVIRGTKLYDMFVTKKYIPMEMEKITRLIIEIKKIVPEYCRIMRLQRDISSKEIIAGANMTNLRQHISKIMKKENLKCRCIRCREIKGGRLGKIIYKSMNYKASNGNEYFLSVESNDKLVGFCRLRLNNKAMIRELHVYGASEKLGTKGKIQHRGYGRMLVNEAEKIARKNNFNKIYVISGIGAREYYSRLGYAKEGSYMAKNFI